jgi:hypothetical protein
MLLKDIMQDSRMLKSCSDGPVLVEYCADKFSKKNYWSVSYSVDGRLGFEKIALLGNGVWKSSLLIWACVSS